MINYFFALDILFNSSDKSVLSNRRVSVKLIDSVKMVNCFDLVAFNYIPVFSNAAMDGYAFNFFKINYNFSCISNNFFIIDIIKAGNLVDFNDFDGDYVIEIMTGARLPSRFNVVVKIEDACLKDNNPFDLIITRYLNLYENVRFLGEDFAFGDFLIRKGQIISCANIMSVSAFGVSELSVFNCLKIFLICTGDEITDSFNLDSDRFYVKNSIACYFISFFKELGIDVVYLGVSSDFKNVFKKKIYNILSYEKNSIIITTGAVSKGRADFIPTFLIELGARILFHGISIKPGKPILFAKYRSNYFFCLPGNPISSIIGLRFFIYPFLQHLNGCFFDEPLKAVLDGDYLFERKCDLFLKSFTYFYNSKFYVKIVTDQQSFKVQSFSRSNSFAFLRMTDRAMKGDILNVYFYQPYNLVKYYDYGKC